MRELKTRYIAAEHRILGSEQHKNLMEVKCNDAQREAKECLEKMSELNARSRSVEDIKNVLFEQKQRYEIKITHLESESSSSSARELELESRVEECQRKICRVREES